MSKNEEIIDLMNENAQLKADLSTCQERVRDVVEWLNTPGRTNKKRRGRIPAKLLEALEDILKAAQTKEEKR